MNFLMTLLCETVDSLNHTIRIGEIGASESIKIIIWLKVNGCQSPAKVPVKVWNEQRSKNGNVVAFKVIE